MPLVEVACPGCQAVLKAPDTMAGKKARCKRCNTSFLIPGGAAKADSVGESQQLSAVAPTPAARKPVAPPPDEEDIPSAMAVDDEEPVSAAPPEEESEADPFAFSAAPAPKKPSKPRDEVPPPPPPAVKKKSMPAPVKGIEPAPAAEDPSADPFAFSAAPPTNGPDRPAAKKKPAPAPVKPVEAPPPPAAEEPSADPFAFSAASPTTGDPTGDEEPAPEADAGDPFGFSPAAASGPKSKSKLKPARKPRDEDADDDSPAAKKKPAGGGGGIIKVAVAAAVFALVAGGVVAGVLIYLNNKPGDQAKNEKKDEKKLDTPTPVEPPPEKAEPTTKAKDSGKATKGTPTVGNKATKGSKGSGAMLSLGKAKALELPPKPADPKTRTEPSERPLQLAAPFAEAKRFFPPEKSGADIGVAWRSATGFQGAGEKITISLFSPTSGTETAKLEADGDGQAEPACDLSADSGTFAIGHRGSSKVTVWDVRKKAKKLDAFDPYKEKPEHKTAKLAAVYLTEPPDRVVTVTTAGAVHVWDVATKAEVGEYVPPRAAVGKVVAGRGAAALANRQGVVVAVGGAIYSVNAVGVVGGGEVASLDGDVGKSLAVAVSPGGRVVYAFETDADGKRERAVAHLSEGKLGAVFRWPADVGEPTAASWSGDQAAVVSAGPGAGVVFDGEEGRFRPQAAVRAAGDKAAVLATDGGLWALQPAATDAKACVALGVALPLPPTGDLTTPPDRRPVASMVLDLKGLAH